MGALILVVEDDALIADDLQRTLVGLGYDVPCTAATGREAIEAAARLRPKLVLLDIKLQGSMDGIEVAAVIRRDYDIPIIYLTSHSDPATLARAIETSPLGYLVKPFKDMELRTAIEVALHKHQLDARLVARERWFSTTLQSIGDAVISTDEYETITFMNAVAETLTGWPNGTALRHKLGEVFRLVDAAGRPVDSPATVALQKSFAVALHRDTALLVRADERLAVDDSASPIVDEQGNLLGAVVVFRDVTERKRLEQRLAQSERLASLGTLAAGVGHEINNPLAAVMGNITFATEAIEVLKSSLASLNLAPEQQQVVAGATKTLEELAEALSDANEAADRVRHIVHDLKRFTRADDSSRTVLELSDVLDSAAKMTMNVVRHHARFRKRYGTTPYVTANEGQLTQVFMNLLVNAAEATEDGRAEHNEICVATFTDAAGRAVAEVRDTGSGIAAHVLPRIFDPFFTTKPVGEGTGLGLAISHSIIAALGGEIVVESRPGEGTIFRVALPGAHARASSRPTAQPEEARTRRGKLLIVDDEISVARSLERILRQQHDVTVTASGAEALAAIAAVGCFDVIFCDLMMPQMSGMDLFDSVRRANPEQARRMVFLTGGAFSPRAKEFLESVENVRLLKPFAAEEVRSITRDYVK